MQGRLVEFLVLNAIHQGIRVYGDGVEERIPNRYGHWGWTPVAQSGGDLGVGSFTNFQN